MSVLEPLVSGLGKGIRQNVWIWVAEGDLTGNVGLGEGGFRTKAFQTRPHLSPWPL